MDSSTQINHSCRPNRPKTHFYRSRPRSLTIAHLMSLRRRLTMELSRPYQTNTLTPNNLFAVNWRVNSSKTHLNAPKGGQQLSQHSKEAKPTRQSAIRANDDLRQQLLSWQISQNMQESMKSYAATDGGSNKQSK
jgi:hypothetical protein